MKPTKYTYEVNGCQQSSRGFAAVTFGDATLSQIEALLARLDGMNSVSISATSKMGNRITISAVYS